MQRGNPPFFRYALRRTDPTSRCDYRALHQICVFLIGPVKVLGHADPELTDSRS